MDYPLAIIGGFLCLCGFMMLILLFLLSMDRRRWFERTSNNNSVETTEQVKEIKQIVAKVVYQPDPEDLIAIAIQ